MISTLDCAIITSEAKIEALAGEWRALQERIGSSIFTDYEWFAIWWRTIGSHHGRTLHVITGRRNGQLVALLPLAVIPRKGFRTLQYIGAESFYLCDMLCENAADADTLWQTARKSPYYDFAHIRDVCPGSVCIPALESFAHLHDQDKELALRLQWPDAEAWKATLSKQFCRKLDKAQRHLEEQGTVRYELCEVPPVPEEIIKGMVEHKTAWCNAFGHTGMFDQPDILSFFQQMAHDGARRKTLVLAWLTCGEAVIAYHLMYTYKKTIYSYIMAIDAAWLKYSPGHLAHVNAIGWAIENGFELFDHMQGDFAYKYQFSNDIRECREYMFSNSFKGWLGEHLFIKRRMLQRKIKAMRKKKGTA